MRSTNIVLLVAAFGCGCLCRAGEDYPDPERFEGAIEAFDARDLKDPPPEGAIVCIGSSSMRGWHGTIEDDLSPLTVIPRGFGGSTMKDVLHFSDRIVLAYRPRAIVLYEGDNDIAFGVAPGKVLDTFAAFCNRVQDELPECRIYVLSIKPSMRRWEMWPQMRQANSLLEAMCREDERLVFVDVASPMLDDDGFPKTGIFKADKLHLNRDGYVLWRDALRPVLLQRELAFER